MSSLRRAAEILREEAERLRQSVVVGSRGSQAQGRCDEMLALAAELDGGVLAPIEATMGQWDDFSEVCPISFDMFMEAYKAMLAPILKEESDG